MPARSRYDAFVRPRAPIRARVVEETCPPTDPSENTEVILAVSRRAATMMLVEDAWYCAVDDLTGRPRLTEERFDLLLAAARLGVLLSTGRVHITDDVLVVDNPARHRPVMRLHQRIHADSSMRSVRGWLQALAPRSRAAVTRRLVDIGAARPRRRRCGLGPVWAEPVDTNRAAAPAARLSCALDRGVPLDNEDLLLWGLIHAVDLARVVLPDHHHLTVALPARAAALAAATTDLVVARVAAPHPF